MYVYVQPLSQYLLFRMQKLKWKQRQRQLDATTQWSQVSNGICLSSVQTQGVVLRQLFYEGGFLAEELGS